MEAGRAPAYLDLDSGTVHIWHTDGMILQLSEFVLHTKLKYINFQYHNSKSMQTYYNDINDLPQTQEWLCLVNPMTIRFSVVHKTNSPKPIKRTAIYMSNTITSKRSWLSFLAIITQYLPCKVEWGTTAQFLLLLLSPTIV